MAGVPPCQENDGAGPPTAFIRLHPDEAAPDSSPARGIHDLIATNGWSVGTTWENRITMRTTKRPALRVSAAHRPF
jgi:hypothetical protein